MRRLLTALLGATLLVGACGGDDTGDQSAVTSIPDERSTSSSSTTSEPRTVAPDVIPQDVSLITEEYVEQVLNELLAVAGDALRQTVAARLVEERAIELIEATSSADTVTDDLNELLDIASSGFEGIKEEPTQLRAVVLNVLERGNDCVFAEIELDRTGVVEGEIRAEPGVRTFVKLLPATEEQRASGQNPTSWVTDGLPTTTDGLVPSNVCST
jgi:hypothetical protein